jgi:divalent metal cation (Fe/Co/Zn/Cd) transporter
MQKLLNTALLLSLITIGYNIIEGGLSIYFGYNDDTLALLGFGIDSFVEVLSGLGILHMVIRMKKRGTALKQRDSFERTALKITGTAFYLLTAGLLTGAILDIIKKSQPITTLVGVIVSVISILTMYLLMHYKFKVGQQLNSDAIIADANCTRTCFYLSFVLLISSGLYELWHIPYVDAAGSLGIAWFSFSEGRESWEKSRSNSLNCHC